jgi:hypothetical protein
MTVATTARTKHQRAGGPDKVTAKPSGRNASTVAHGLPHLGTAAAPKLAASA